MADFDIEGAVVRLYDDASLTGDMTDEPAKRVLKWAEAQLENAAKTSADEAAFDEAQKHVRLLVKAFNQYIAAQQGGDFEAQQEAVGKATERAAALGYAPQMVAADAFSAQSAEMDEMGAVESLLGMIQGKTDAQAAPKAASSEVTVEDNNAEAPPTYQSAYAASPPADTANSGGSIPDEPDEPEQGDDDSDELKWEY
jgi:hypothetical protein